MYNRVQYAAAPHSEMRLREECTHFLHRNSSLIPLLSVSLPDCTNRGPPLFCVSPFEATSCVEGARAEMYGIVPWLGEANTFLLLSIVIVGFITLTVLWRLRWLDQWRTFRAGVPPGSPRDVLNAGNLSFELRTVTGWHRLGINLGLQTYELSRIEQDYQGNKRRMLEMLDLWLQRPPATPWGDLANALQEMGENRVAESIRHKYIRGRSKSK